MPLNDSLAQTIADKIAPLIVSQTTPSNDPPVVQTAAAAQNWNKIVKLIANEIFDQIKANAVVEVKELISIQVAGGLFSTTGPVAGVIVGGSAPQITPGSPPPTPPPSSSISLKGKIT